MESQENCSAALETVSDLQKGTANSFCTAAVQAAEANKEVADLEQQLEKASAAEPVTAASADSHAAATEGQVAADIADSRPASLRKSQDAAAARQSGEEIGDTGADVSVSDLGLHGWHQFPGPFG